MSHRQGRQSGHCPRTVIRTICFPPAGRFRAMLRTSSNSVSSWSTPLKRRATSGNPDVMEARVSADVVTPIALSGLQANTVGNGVRIQWYVADVAGITGFRVHRAEGAGMAYRPVTASVIAQDHEGQYDLVDSD